MNRQSPNNVDESLVSSVANLKLNEKQGKPKTQKPTSEKQDLHDKPSKSHVTHKKAETSDSTHCLLETPAILQEPPQLLVFESLNKAKKACKWYFEADLTHPEETAPHVMAERVPKQLHQGECIKVIKFTLKHLVDVQNHSQVSLWVVCNGRGLALQETSALEWMTDPRIHASPKFGFHHGSSHIEGEHKSKFNVIW